ncbi:MAG: hypothetical protein HDR28_07915 [Lachnospiraceae bacterium]|nr:hypothetical protein [Lachnospiraceae bacterium]
MNINIQRLNNSIFGGMTVDRGLKSVQQKAERQEERDNKIAFFEQQKDNLKNIKCETVEEIAKKLDMFHSYEDQIAAAKAAYNNEQMMHIMDESRERGEKIAEAAEKMAPKTAEERLEDLVEEAMGIDEGAGVLDEVMDEVAEIQEELQDAVQDELKDTVQEEIQDTVEQEFQDIVEEGLQEEVQGQAGDETVQMAAGIEKEMNAEQLQKKLYTPIDLRI